MCLLTFHVDHVLVTWSQELTHSPFKSSFEWDTWSDACAEFKHSAKAHRKTPRRSVLHELAGARSLSEGKIPTASHRSDLCPSAEERTEHRFAPFVLAPLSTVHSCPVTT